MSNTNTFTVDGEAETRAGTDAASERTDEASEAESAVGAPTEEVRSSEPSLPLDQTFEILKNQRRRYVLQYLDAADGAVSLSDLAEQIAAWENDKEIRQITSSERKRVYVGLYQCHLPKMAGMDIVSFNKPRGVVERGENADCFEPYLRGDNSEDDGLANRYQAGLAVLGIGLLPVTVVLLTNGLVPVAAAVLCVCALAAATSLRLFDDDDA